MIFFAFITFCLTFVNADPRCPFPSCSRTYTIYSGCSITCNSATFPNVGSINVSKINYLYLNNLENIPKNAFQGLEIYQLSISSQNLLQVDEGAFDNINKLDRLLLSGNKNLSILFENRLEALYNVTNYLSLSNVGLNNQSVIKILDKLKYWTKLSGLSLSSNNFQFFSYDFNNFTSLSGLYLSLNLIETFDIKSNFLRTLNLGYNRISKFEKEMFADLPNLSYLDLKNNQIKNIYNDSFISTKKLQSIYLSNNYINYIEPNSFCELSFNKYSSLGLSGNNLSDTNLYCLENVSNIYLSSVKFKGEIDQKRLGNARNVIHLDLDNNNINKISFENMTSLETFYLNNNELESFTCETIKAFPNLVSLYIRKNKFTDNNIENFNLLKKLKNLYLSENLFTRIDSNNFNQNNNLYLLDINNNKIESVEFGFLKNLNNIYLKNNELRVIDKKSFAQLPNLGYLDLGYNSIGTIRPKAFHSNIRLSFLNLQNNQLTTTPDISNLKILNELDLRNNKIRALPNHAFERRLDESNPLKSEIKIDLRTNSIESFTSKTFCSQHASSLGFLGFEFWINDINQMDKCMLRQFNSDKIKINSNTYPSCEHLLMAKYKNIFLNGNVTQCEHLSTDFIEKECYSNSKYKCPKGDELIRHTTWITGDPHLYSYKNKYELCATGQDAVCFQYGDFQLLCSDSQIGSLNQLATVLVSVKFVYKLSDSLNITFEANKTSFPAIFDNGQEFIYKNEKTSYSSNDILVQLISVEDGSKVIYIPKANTHIFISRWNSFYSITLRTTHDTYSESIGYLYEGCDFQDHLKPRIPRQIIDKQTLDCQTECSKIQFSTEEENMPQEVIRNACSFDCTEIGLESIAMIQSMVNNIDVYLLSDSYADLAFSNTSQEMSFSSISQEMSFSVSNEETSIENLNFSTLDVNVTTSSQSPSQQSTGENFSVTSSIDDILTKESSTTTSGLVLTEDNEGFFSVKMYTILGIAAVIIILILIILVLLYKLKKNKRVSNKDETEMDNYY